MNRLSTLGNIIGSLPVSVGRTYWVAPADSYTVDGTTYAASDGNAGRTPDKALRTLGRALELVAADVSDTIILLPGTHTLTAQASVTTAGITITGLPGSGGHPHRKKAVLTSSAADETLLIGAARVEMAHLHLVPVTAQAAIEVNASGDYFYLHDCSAEMVSPVASTATMIVQSIAASGGLTNLRIENLYVETVGGQGPALDLNDVVSAEIVNCTFRLQGATAWADAVASATGAVDVLFDTCRWLGGTGAVITDAIDWTGNTIDGSAQLLNCYFSLGSGNLNGSADADLWVTSTSEISQTAAGGSNPINVLNAG
jgi:hypothetical protein